MLYISVLRSVFSCPCLNKKTTGSLGALPSYLDISNSRFQESLFLCTSLCLNYSLFSIMFLSSARSLTCTKVLPVMKRYVGLFWFDTACTLVDFYIQTWFLFAYISFLVVKFSKDPFSRGTDTVRIGLTRQVVYIFLVDDSGVLSIRSLVLTIQGII